MSTIITRRDDGSVTLDLEDGSMLVVAGPISDDEVQRMIERENARIDAEKVA